MNIPSPIQKLDSPLFKEKEVEVWIKRDDLIHTEISGNKWRKLKYNLEKCKAGNYKSLLTFGGAYSNHILATAKIGFDHNIKTIGIIRGEEHLPLNPTLQQSIEFGMELHYTSRTDYRKKAEQQYLFQLKKQFNNPYIIPEGGGNIEGVLGCKDIVEEINFDFDYILTDCGTGATLAGLNLALKPHQKAIGIPVLKGGEFINKEVSHFYKLLNTDYSTLNKIDLALDYHFGGYAKHKQELIDFMRSFYKQTTIKTDPIYTGKLFFGFMDLVKKDYFPRGSKVVVVHTGGLQGIEGFEKRYKFKLYQ